MSLPLIMPGAVGDQLAPRLTADGIRVLLADLRKSERGVPKAILVSEYDRRELNQDLLAGSVRPVEKQDQAPEHDGNAIAIIEGVPIMAHPHVERGRCRLIYLNDKQVAANQPPPRLGGEGLIVVGV